MSELQKVQSIASFGGTLEVFDHQSTACNSTMRFAVYTPPPPKWKRDAGPMPVLWYLSGLTCNWSNVAEKSGFQRYAAEHGMMVICSDTSPRSSASGGDDVPDDEAYDLGQGAGFYINATQEPWAKHFQMETYIAKELPALIAEHFSDADMTRQGIFGHSMGGHGALTLHLKYPDSYVSVSAFSPIVAPSRVPWGEKAFTAYLGDDRAQWTAHDASVLVRRRSTNAHILIDQGEADDFLGKQLKPNHFATACSDAGQALTLRMQPGYDHSYYFIASFMGDHFTHHAKALKSNW